MPVSARAAARRVAAVTRSRVACGGTEGQNQNAPAPAYVEMNALALPGAPDVQARKIALLRQIRKLATDPRGLVFYSRVQKDWTDFFSAAD